MTSVSGGAIGGGICNLSGSLALTNVIVSGNSAVVSGSDWALGGGIYSTGTLAITNVTLSRNRAISSGSGGAIGGAIDYEGAGATLTMTNAAVSGNVAACAASYALGGGIAAYHGTLTNVTVSGNAAVGPLNQAFAGGISCGSTSTLSLYNSIVALNTNGDGSGWTGSNNLIGQDPLFVRDPSAGTDGLWGTADDDAGDMRLRAGSPALNAGSNAWVPAGITTDITGTPRIVGGIVDIGAYERQPNRAPTDLALSPTSIPENQPPGTAVSQFSSTDLDVGNTFAYSLVTGDGDADNAAFTIIGNTLQTAASLDAEAKSSYSIRVRTIDADGLSFEKAFTIGVTNVRETTVAGRQLFYNRSTFDGNNAAANASDDTAIATDKSALLPGQTATLSNYSSYSRGLNGIMLDLGSFSGTLSASDFTFKVGNNSTPSGWATAPAPASITPRAIAGGVTRVTLIWADNTIQKQWLQVTLLASVNSDLAVNDVFYFGNAIAETGNSAANATVNSTDEALVKNHQTGLTTVGITSVYDLNRDTRVNTSDLALARNNKSGLTPLVLIAAPAGSGAAMVQSRAAATVAERLVLTDVAPAAQSPVPTWSQNLLFPDGSAVAELLV